MTTDRDPEFTAWIDEARTAPILTVAQSRPWGSALKKAGHDFHMSCPVCGGKDGNEFIITPRKNVFLCRKSGKGGDTLAMVQHAEGQAKGAAFTALVEEITGKAPPRREETTVPRSAGAGRDTARERREERLDDLLARMEFEAADYRQKCTDSRKLYERCQPFDGSHAAAYLKARKVLLRPAQTKHFRFLPACDYWGYADPESKELVKLGSFPAMVAPFMLPSGEIIGLHRTYLDPDRPGKLDTRKIDGDPRRNKAKKMLGNKRGGLIYMGEPRAVLACGEGIETTGSWYGLDPDPSWFPPGIDPDDVWIAAAGDLGNLCGAATGTVPHPTNAKRTVPNGEPDLEAAIAQLPDVTTGTILLGDGDSDPHWTRAVLLTGARRRKIDGYDVWVQMAAEGEDFNSMAIGVAA